MRYFFTRLLISIICSLLFLQYVGLPTEAVVSTVGPRVKVSASVGSFYLNLSGFASPYASLILTSDNVFYRSVVADQKGSFSIGSVLINQGFSHFCLRSVDFKHLGESTACFTIDPAYASVTINNIFLPPTLGLQRSEITAGSNAVAYGYTMPGALVTLTVSDGKSLTAIADGNGYYMILIKKLAAGTYQLYATATYNGIASSVPMNKITLTAVTVAEQVTKKVGKEANKFVQNLKKEGQESPLGLLWFAIPLLALIYLMLHKLWPKYFPSLKPFSPRSLFDRLFPGRKRLHHWWFVGY